MLFLWLFFSVCLFLSYFGLFFIITIIIMIIILDACLYSNEKSVDLGG